MRNRCFSVLLCLVLLLLSGLSSVCAEDDTWTCPVCGSVDNIGNYCPFCGTSRPGTGWTCSGCGQEGNTGDFCVSCGMYRTDAVPEPVVTAVPVDENLEKIPGESDHVKLRISSVDASRFSGGGADPSKWAPAKAADGDPGTCWQFDTTGKSTLSKTWLDLMLPAPQRVDAVWFRNGFRAFGADGKDQYPIFARPRQLTVEFMPQGSSDFGDGVTITLPDDKTDPGWQRFELGPHENVVGVRIRVVTYYRGTRYPNYVCLSEVMLVQNSGALFASEPRAAAPAEDTEASVSPGVLAPLKDTVAGRCGPSTKYEEPGSFFLYDSWRGQNVRAIAKAHVSGVWWVEVDFQYQNASWRVWTGLKRVNVDTSLLPEAKVIGSASLRPTKAWFGPGSNYATSSYDVLSPVNPVEIYAAENGFVQVDFYDSSRGFQRRIWVPESALDNIAWY